MTPIPVFFHRSQLAHKPRYEWTFGRKIAHPETTRRAERILAAIEADPVAFEVREPQQHPLQAIRRVHDQRLIALYRAAERLEPGVTFYPSVFPKRHQAHPDPEDVHQAGYFCFDSGTPLNRTTWEAAAWSAADAECAGRAVSEGAPLAYALCRPPGHHASRDLFGGYCYFNNAAIVARRLRRRGRVALVDIDFHHGNGTQQIFWHDPRVLFLSLHGDPREFYPYFSGHAKETGAGPGAGFTVNEPLPKGCDGQEYLRVIDARILPKIRDFDPAFLVVSAGFDTFRDDPIGHFTLDTADYHPLGDRLGRLGLPSVVVQEGGYATKELGNNVTTFLRGMRDGRATFDARGGLAATR